MTNEEAARILAPETTIGALAEIEYYAGFSGKAAKIQAVSRACELAAIALRAQAEAEKNDPLTLGELRQMVGDPVCIYNAYNGFYTWHVVDTISKKAIVFTDGEARLLNCYGNGWLAYRRRPEDT